MLGPLKKGTRLPLRREDERMGGRVGAREAHQMPLAVNFPQVQLVIIIIPSKSTVNVSLLPSWSPQLMALSVKV